MQDIRKYVISPEDIYDYLDIDDQLINLHRPYLKKVVPTREINLFQKKNILQSLQFSSHFISAVQKNSLVYEFYFYPFIQASYIVNIVTESNFTDKNIINTRINFYGYKTDYTYKHIDLIYTIIKETLNDGINSFAKEI